MSTNGILRSSARALHFDAGYGSGAPLIDRGLSSQSRAYIVIHKRTEACYEYECRHRFLVI